MTNPLAREIIELAVRHLRTTKYVRPDGGELPNLYPLLAEALAERCKPYLDQAARGAGKYRPLSDELPAIAKALGLDSPIKDPQQPAEETMAAIMSARKDMGRAKGSRLAPSIIAWLWQTDEHYTRRLFQRMRFDLAGAQASLDQLRLAPNEQFGATSHSLYTLQGQLEIARSRLVLIAQNHWHMVSSEDRHGARYWPMILAALTRGVDIDIVAMHPDVGPRGKVAGQPPPSAIEVWAQFLNTPEIPKQIERCWNRLHEWGEAYRAALNVGNSPKNMGTLRAFGAYFTPLTLSMIDPEDADGAIIVSPRTSDPKAASRPQFAVHRGDNPEGFTYYWSYVENALSDQHWVKMLG